MIIKEKIRAFIIDNFLFGDDRGLQDNSSFLEDGVIDSTGIMQLVAFLGDEFSVVIADEELVPENLDSINQVTSFVEKKVIFALPQTKLDLETVLPMGVPALSV